MLSLTSVEDIYSYSLTLRSHQPLVHPPMGSYTQGPLGERIILASLGHCRGARTGMTGPALAGPLFL